jgi:hypothetical protein
MSRTSQAGNTLPHQRPHLLRLATITWSSLHIWHGADHEANLGWPRDANSLQLSKVHAGISNILQFGSGNRWKVSKTFDDS